MAQRTRTELLATVRTTMVGLLLSVALAKAVQLNQENTWLNCQPGRGINLQAYISGLDKVKDVRTLVLALSTTSPYCSESAGFYKRLEQERAKDVRLVALFPHFLPAPIARRYLQEEGLQVDEVQQLRFDQVGIHGTPTLLLLDDSGTVLDAWVGKLQPLEEQEVIAAVKGPLEFHPQAADGPRARDVVIEPESPWDAVKILRITDAGQDILPGRYLSPYLPGKQFIAADDWEKDLSFTLKNRTSKTIVFLGFDLMFSENDSQEHAVTWWPQLGKVPEVTYGAFHPPDDNVPEGTGSPLQFAPGTAISISLAGYADTIKAWVEERGHPLPSIRTCALLVTQVFFEDGMRWGLGYPPSYMYIDKGLPNTWTKSDDFYFPGQLNPISRVPSKLDPMTPDDDM